MNFSFQERNRGLYVLGGTRSGKSTFLKKLMHEDIVAGHGVIFIDPHGPDSLDLLDNIPRHRTEDVIYVDLSDTRRYTSIKLPIEPVLLTQDLKDVFGEVLSDRAQWLLINGLQLLKDAEKPITDLKRVYYDARFRDRLLNTTAHPLTRAFWGPEYKAKSARTIEDEPQTIHNKIGQLTFNHTIRRMFSDPHPKVDLEHAIRFKQIVVINLAKGRIGETPASLIGAMLISHVKNILMRGTVAECRLYVDEFQSFGTDVFATMLAECAKFGLCLTLSHQFLGQLREKNRTAILANAGTIICFRISPADESVMNPYFDTREHQDRVRTSLSSQASFQAHVRTVYGDVERHACEPFITPHKGSLAKVVAASAMRFSRMLAAPLGRQA